MKKIKKYFSLLELIIVLGILAALAAILLDNFADMKARECENLTRERGGQIRDIVKGTRTEDGIGRFLSDMGRFPSVYVPTEGDGDGGRRLAELYDPSIWYVSGSATALQKLKTITAAEIRDLCQKPDGSTFPADGSGIMLPYPEVSMNVGWNGPYLSLTAPVNGKFYDGWGRAWKIITNYNLRVNSDRLEENHTTEDKIKVYETEAEMDALRSGKTRVRIDGIVSYGANDADDSNTDDVSAADADQKFIFAHNMDNHGAENIASLKVILKLRDRRSGEWTSLPAISSWESGRTYSKGEIVTSGGKMYCCIEAHTAGTAFAVSDVWSALEDAAAYVSSTHGALNYNALCIYDDAYYLRRNGNEESTFTASNWLRIADVGTLPDSISLFLFTPVMQGAYDSRVMELGYYHFFRNSNSENAFGVKPLYGVAGKEDIECTGDTTTIYSTDYNGRYLIAEDHSSAAWNEFFIKRLIPGQRKIFCIIYDSRTQSCRQSQVELLKLRPGSNVVTLYLEQKL